MVAVRMCRPLFLHPLPPGLDEGAKTEAEMAIEHILGRLFRLVVVQEGAKSIPPLCWRRSPPRYSNTDHDSRTPLLVPRKLPWLLNPFNIFVNSLLLSVNRSVASAVPLERETSIFRLSRARCQGRWPGSWRFPAEARRRQRRPEILQGRSTELKSVRDCHVGVEHSAGNFVGANGEDAMGRTDVDSVQGIDPIQDECERTD